MKKNLIALLILTSLVLQACTVRIWTPTYVDAVTGKQLWKVATYFPIGETLPYIDIYNPYRQMSPR